MTTVIVRDIEHIGQTLPIDQDVFVVLDRNVSHLASHFNGCFSIEIDADEQRKTLLTVEHLHRWLLEQGADRSALLLGVGGGVTTDIVGYVAASYKRGIDVAFVPTTLLSQVDAALGGKNGVNLDHYKNIIGSIRQPRFVYIDTKTLSTLPQREFRAGVAEMLKSFILFDREAYCSCVDLFSGENIEPKLLEEHILKCANYKLSVVSKDEQERGLRRLLNLGHTFAHAIEKLSIGKINYGEAVSIGLLVAAKIARALAHTKSNFALRLEQDLKRLSLPTELPAGLSKSELMKIIENDKKVDGQSINFILPYDIEQVDDCVLEINTLKKLFFDLS